MGCICSRGVETDEIVADIKKCSSRSLSRLVTPLKRDPSAILFDADAASRRFGSGRRPATKSQENLVVPVPVPIDEGEKKISLASVDGNQNFSGHHRRATVDVRVNGADTDSKIGDLGLGMGIFNVPDGFSGEHVAAGWPAWLTNVAAEAVNGWLPRRADSFEKLDKIGQGTYSSVYRARDLESGKIFALKKVRFVNMDSESVRFMAREIHILRRLDHRNIMKLEAIVTSRMSCNLYLVFEYMDHDLAGLAATPGIKFTEPQALYFTVLTLPRLFNERLHHLAYSGSKKVMVSRLSVSCSNYSMDSNTAINAEFCTATSRDLTFWSTAMESLE